MVGPERLHHHDAAFDFRPGGVWRFVMHGPDGRDYQNRVTYRRDRAARAHRLSPWRRRATSSRCSSRRPSTFEDLGNGQTRVTLRGAFPSAEERARVIKEYGADKGLAQTMARLAEYVAAMES